MHKILTVAGGQPSGHGIPNSLAMAGLLVNARKSGSSQASAADNAWTGARAGGFGGLNGAYIAASRAARSAYSRRSLQVILCAGTGGIPGSGLETGRPVA